MASAFSHAIAALGVGACFYHPKTSKRVWIAGALCSVIPDLDVVGFRIGISYADFWGHRGFSHSLLFAAMLSCIVTVVLVRSGSVGIGRSALFAYLFLATASHGFLDAMTNGGLGVAFFSPFENSRYFLPWTPIRVSPISVRRFFSERGYIVLQTELLWVWLPSIMAGSLALALKRKAQTN